MAAASICDASLEINALPVREVGRGPSDQAMPRFEGGVDWHAPFFADN